MLFEKWDPLPWYLRIREWQLRFTGYPRYSAKTGGAPFNYYLRKGGLKEAPLVLIHGLALFPEWWLPLLKRLPKDRSVCAPELLGFGRSPGKDLPPGAFRLSLYREQLNELARLHRWDRMLLAGVSLGGWVCLDYALARPERVSGVILIGPAGVTLRINEDDLLALKELFDYKSGADFIRLMNDHVLYHPRKIPLWVGDQAVRRSIRNGHKHLLQNLKADDWIGERVGELKAPLALIWGKEDKVFPFSLGVELAGLLPSARLFPLEKTGHSYLHERPEATCRAFFEALDFLEKAMGDQSL